MQNSMGYSMMNGHSPQTPQEDYQDPKDRCSCTSVPVLHAGPAYVNGLSLWPRELLRGICMPGAPGSGAATIDALMHAAINAQ